MSTILLSIKPEHVENILNGKKIYEFRKIVCKEEINKIIIYSTTPVMLVVGEALVEEIIIDKPNVVWNITKKRAGIDKKFFDEYYKDRERAVAYKLSCIIEYEVPKKLDDFGIKNAPQSFVYIDN